MNKETIEVLIRRFIYSLEFLYESIGSIDEALLVHQPHGFRNHPIWTLGHLAYSCQATAELFGVPNWLPTGWGATFGTGSSPNNVLENYPTRLELIEKLSSSSDKLMLEIRSCPLSYFSQPLPEKKFLLHLPTIGDASMQILVGHTSYHVGQVSVWKRMMNLPSQSRPFL